MADSYLGCLYTPYVCLYDVSLSVVPLCVYPCSLSTLLLCVYQTCLPLTVVLTTLLCRLVYASYCPRGVSGFSFSVFSSLSVLLLYFCHGLYDTQPSPSCR